jgi:hypothetical protein
MKTEVRKVNPSAGKRIIISWWLVTLQTVSLTSLCFLDPIWILKGLEPDGTRAETPMRSVIVICVQSPTLSTGWGVMNWNYELSPSPHNRR